MPLDFTETLTAWRHHLHAHPELSLQESQTAAFVCGELEKLGIGFEAGIGGHGVVATISKGASNRAVGLRADMDALPITEATGAPYASKTVGVMHACGHDGHTASLLGAAKLLVEDQDWSGTVHLVFQPAEEGFGGAQAMLNDGLLRKFPMERIFGYHNWPGLETGTVMLHDGPLMAAAGNFLVLLRGHAAHAAMPHLGRDPVQAAAHLILAFNAIVARNVDPLDTAVISVTKMQGGQANNQIPDIASIGGTFRAHDEQTMVFLQTRMQDCADSIARMFNLTAETKFSGYLPPTTNHKAEADLAAAAAEALGLRVRRDMKPTMGAEDFGRFLLEIPGSYAWIGNGESAGLHNEKFDYNDEILPIAAKYLAATAKAALQA
jgi:hippurate hydrolase